jgi:hypothetical protein
MMPSRQARSRLRTPIILLVVLFAEAACVPLPGGRELSRKTVWGKEGEATLVADDGSRCEVGSRQFERTKLGDEAVCAWKLPDSRTTRRNPAPW